MGGGLAVGRELEAGLVTALLLHGGCLALLGHLTCLIL